MSLKSISDKFSITSLVQNCKTINKKIKINDLMYELLVSAQNSSTAFYMYFYFLYLNTCCFWYLSTINTNYFKNLSQVKVKGQRLK